MLRQVPLMSQLLGDTAVRNEEDDVDEEERLLSPGGLAVHRTRNASCMHKLLWWALMLLKLQKHI